jgi:flagellar biosynthesis protein
MADEKKPVAVALKYERSKDPAPRVVAKGKGAIAEQIIKVAELNGVTIRQDADLAEILEKLDIDTIIPLEAYAAVAEILNYVYQSNSKAKAARK